MKIFLALDNHNGMALNNRRQSRDSEMLRQMFQMVEESKIMAHSFSQKLLAKEYGNKIIIRDDFLTAAEKTDHCFVENQHLTEHLDKIDTIYVFRWNRDYLADFNLDIDLSEWDREVIKEFVGFSHDRITLEKYTRPMNTNT